MAYIPTHPRADQDVAAWVFAELLTISAELQGFERQLVILTPQAVAPLRPRDGMVVHADGVNWNPGGGKGIYFYATTTWVKL